MSSSRRHSARSDASHAKTSPIAGAVLLVGSLLWEGERPEIDGKKGVLRKRWRDEKLDMGNVKKLAVPIRYGRRSSSRNGQYTMLFGGRGLGAGKLAKLKTPIPAEALTTRLRAETEALAIAEGIRTTNNPHNCADWGGVVAIAINPKSPMRETISAAWRVQFEKRTTFRPGAYGKDIVDEHGFLKVRLPWSGQPLHKVDFVLATPTEPNDANVTPEKIARAMKDGTYFARNREQGITSAGDTAILRALKNARRK